MITKNRKALYDFNVLEKIESGIMLEKWEAKSVRNNQLTLGGSYIIIQDNEPLLVGAHIAPMKDIDSTGLNPTRARKLLLHKREILQLMEKVSEKGLTLIPISAYLKNNKVKIEIGVCKGKNKGDKRNQLKEKAIARDESRLKKSLRI